MSMRLIPAAGAVAAVLALASVAAAPVPARAGEETAKKVEEFKEYLKTNPDSQGIRNAVADLALLKSPEVADALMPMLRNPKYEDDVKIAVCQAVGKQGKKEVAGVLFGLADGKAWEEKPKLRAAALEGVGDADAKSHYKELIKLGKKFQPINGDIAIAAQRAASMYVSRETVDDIITALGVVSGTLKTNELAKRPHYDAARPALIDMLKRMTGLDYGDATAWKRWWSENEKTWEPPGSEKDKEAKKDAASSDTFGDKVYGIEVRKPNKRWSFRKGDGTPWLTVEAMEEGQRAAWCDVFVQESKNMKSQSPEALAKEVRDMLEPKFRDIKPESNWEKPCSYGGQKGVEQIIIGQHKELDAVRMHHVYIYNKGYAIRIETTYKSGKTASLNSDIEQLLKNLVFMK